MLYNRGAGAANLQHDKAIENLQYDLSQDEEANEPSNFQVKLVRFISDLYLHFCAFSKQVLNNASLILIMSAFY